MCAVLGPFWVVDGCEFLYLVLGVVGDDKLDWVNDCRYACCTAVQILAYGTFEQCKIVECVVCGVSDFINKVSEKAVGEAIAKKALEKGIKAVVFDRGGYVYHGRVAALAEGAREGGLDF